MTPLHLSRRFDAAWRFRRRPRFGSRGGADMAAESQSPAIAVVVAPAALMEVLYISIATVGGIA